MIELLFDLDQDGDGWPPVAVEGLWCERSDGRYLVQTCPVFVKGLSVGDVIEVQQSDSGTVESFSLIATSRNSTVWLMFRDRTAIDDVLQQLRSIGCDTTGPLDGMEAKLCSINVPADLDFAEVDAILVPFEASGRAAVAYPSIRHPGG